MDPRHPGRPGDRELGRHRAGWHVELRERASSMIGDKVDLAVQHAKATTERDDHRHVLARGTDTDLYATCT